MDDKLKTLLADPVAAAVRFEVVNQEIDWFDLRIVIDVEGVQLSKEQIRALVAARGGYVRMDDGGWMRLEIKLDNDQRDAVTRLGLDPFDLSGETHRMHAMQLADPKAAEVFDPKAWKRIKDRTAEIQIDVKPDVPSQLQATLRPYQVEGFHFLAYLATNGFGGILADDMGLGKTIQSITYVLWLREEFARKTNPRKKSSSLRFLSFAPNPCWTSGREKRKICARRARPRHPQQGPGQPGRHQEELRHGRGQLRPAPRLRGNPEPNQMAYGYSGRRPADQNPDSKAAKAAREIVSYNRLVLSGTPIENRLLDMWSLMAFSMPGVLGSRSYFKKRFDKRKDPQSQNRLAARLKPFLLRRTKSQVAKDLPPRTEEEVYAKMEGIQSQLYKAELRRIQQALLGLDSDESVKRTVSPFCRA